MADNHEIFIPLLPENNSYKKYQKFLIGIVTLVAIGFIIELILICVKYFS